MAGNQNLEVLKPIDKVSLGEITSHRAVTTVNANVASKQLDDRFHETCIMEPMG